MKLEKIRELAAQRGLKINKLNKAEIIRSIQTSEGNTTCFDTGAAAECGQMNCLWREDCK